MKAKERQAVMLGVAGLVVVMLTLGLAAGVILGREVLPDPEGCVEVPVGTRAEFELMAEVWTTIERGYVDQDAVQPRPMAYSAIAGMVDGLGDVGHTRFLTPEMAERHEDQIRGRFEGIGAYVEMREGRVVIVAPIDESPAQRAGLKPGDVILEVDGEDVTELPLDAAVDRVLGPAGTEVTLTILDPGTGESRRVTLERAEIKLDLVTWQRLPGTSVAYVRISAFSEGASDELEEALDEIQAQGLGAVLLDLRSNPGGLLDEAVGVTSLLVETGNVLLRRDADGGITEEPVKERVEAVDLPLVALADGGTASAAEIVTGALQDHGRASVVGTTTFGAGTVLNGFTLSDGSLLLLAVEEWLTPDGRVIWQKGLAPDVEVALAPEAQPLVGLGLQDVTETELRESDDVQLLRALELVETSIGEEGGREEGGRSGHLGRRVVIPRTYHPALSPRPLVGRERVLPEEGLCPDA
ncbi:MAG: S41 family peptidase [Chloroflexota bacterium]